MSYFISEDTVQAPARNYVGSARPAFPQRFDIASGDILDPQRKLPGAGIGERESKDGLILAQTQDQRTE